MAEAGRGYAMAWPRSGPVPRRLVLPTRWGRVPPGCRSAGFARPAGAQAHGFLDEAGINVEEAELAAADQPHRAAGVPDRASDAAAVVPQNQLCDSYVIADREACSAPGNGAGFAGRG